ncbi:MAG: 4Fe-4S binding protein [Candidatus Binatia bacterium]
MDDVSTHRTPPPRRPASWSRWVAPLDRLVGAVDAATDRLWTSALNPLHQSGTLAILSFGVLVATGIYLFLFYSIDEPYESVSRMENELPGGGWVRSLHTYAADLALLSTLVHALKMFLAGRFSGARVRAWLSGVVLVGVVLLCGWTGQVMVWDLQAQVVAVELTRLLDLLPVFSMPMGRAFDGLAPVASSFFFMNLFLHVCLPLGLALVLWLHVSRIARPALLPPRPLMWSVLGILAVASAVVRVPISTPADLLVIPKDVPVDVLFNFWLPAAWSLGPAWHASLWAVTAVCFASVPWWWRNKRPRLAPSWADPDLCTGCTTCYKDCPFDAITMVARPDPGRRSDFYALVNPERCVSCGVCAGSCAPMGVGPPWLTGRVQLRREHELLADGYLPAGNVVVFACGQNALSRDPRLAAMEGVTTRVVECAGGLHTSVIDLALRSASAAVVLTCPPRSASCREGPKWLHERLYNDREAELPPRIDKSRVTLLSLSPGEWPTLARMIRDRYPFPETRDRYRFSQSSPARPAAAADAAPGDSTLPAMPGAAALVTPGDSTGTASPALPARDASRSKEITPADLGIDTECAREEGEVREVVREVVKEEETRSA